MSSVPQLEVPASHSDVTEQAKLELSPKLRARLQAQDKLDPNKESSFIQRDLKSTGTEEQYHLDTK